MARTRRGNAVDRERESLFWLQFGVLALVILILAAILWALITVSSLESGPPRTAVERQVRALEAAVQQSPGDVGSWVKLIRIQSEGGQIRAAERAVAGADEALGSRKGAVATEVARIALLEEDYVLALDEVNSAIELLEQETKAEIERLTAMGVSQPPDQASTVDAHLLKADVLTARGDLAAAVEAYTAALALKPTMADVLVERGRLHADLGEVDAARADYAAALTFIPDYGPALEALAELERQ